jgi:MoxR-like ATPase
MRVLGSQQRTHPLDSLEQVASEKDLMQAQEMVRDVFVSVAVKRYIIEIANQTRTHPEVYLGVSTRGSLALFAASQTMAAVRGRDYVIPDDVKTLVKPTIAHRLILGPSARLRDVSDEQVVDEIIGKLPAPGGDLMREDGA